jgi:hypothetical protein
MSTMLKLTTSLAVGSRKKVDVMLRSIGLDESAVDTEAVRLSVLRRVSAVGGDLPFRADTPVGQLHVVSV